MFKKLSTFNKKQKGKGIKTLTPKQMPQRLPIAMQCNWKLTNWNLSNHIFFVSRNSKLDSGNSKIFDRHRLLLSLSD